MINRLVEHDKRNDPRPGKRSSLPVLKLRRRLAMPSSPRFFHWTVAQNIANRTAINHKSGRGSGLTTAELMALLSPARCAIVIRISFRRATAAGRRRAGAGRRNRRYC